MTPLTKAINYYFFTFNNTHPVFTTGLKTRIGMFLDATQSNPDGPL